MVSKAVIVAYKAKPGHLADLLKLTEDHVKILRREGLATDMPAVILLSEDETLIEIFEWAPGAMEAAHSNAAVQQMWAQYAEVSDYVPLASVPEAAQLFASFKRVTL